MRMAHLLPGLAFLVFSAPPASAADLTGAAILVFRASTSLQAAPTA
jgi:hypothetical protein